LKYSLSTVIKNFPTREIYVTLYNVLTFFVESIAFFMKTSHNTFRVLLYDKRAHTFYIFLKGRMVTMQGSIKPEQTRENLKAAISIKRREMIELGMKYGLTDKRTIRCSQQLDSLLNLYKYKKNNYVLTG